MQRLIVSLLILILFFGGLVGLTSAAGVSEAYIADTPLIKGTLVSRIIGEEKKVEATNLDNIDRMFGVVVVADESSLSLGNSDQNTVFVSSDSELSVIVNDLNGPINAGDLLSVSTLSGTATKASNQATVIGSALTDFSGSDEQTIGTTTVNRQGKETIVRLGRVQVQFEIAANPAANDAQSKIPVFLQAIGDSLAGKHVSPGRLITATLALLISLVTSGTLLFGAVKSSISSIGRNPLSSKAIYAGMAQVFLLVVVVLAAGVASVYIILKV